MRIYSNRECPPRNVPAVPVASYIPRDDSLEGHSTPLQHHRPQIGKFQVVLQKSWNYKQ